MVIITIGVAWAVVGDVGSAASIGIVANGIKTGTYYAYERAWDHVFWGIPNAE